jgi:hypothetical protein
MVGLHRWSLAGLGDGQWLVLSFLGSGSGNGLHVNGSVDFPLFLVLVWNLDPSGSFWFVGSG